uniref:Uncharacterized protein n=1 Tax=viral metagenome TaxID=1070528 RepID=A0A6M3LNH4_9ZZZZ
MGFENDIVLNCQKCLKGAYLEYEIELENNDPDPVVYLSEVVFTCNNCLDGLKIKKEEVIS